MNKNYEKVNDADYIKKNARLIEMVLESFGIPVRVVKINIQHKFYEYCKVYLVAENQEFLKKYPKKPAIDIKFVNSNAK